MSQFRGNQVISGSHGKVWWDGEMIFEVQAFNAKVTAEREDVIIEGNKDSKIISLAGEGSLTVKKVYTRNLVKLLDAWKKGNDPRMSLVGSLQDPDSVRKQQERIALNNVWFNEITLMDFEAGAKTDLEYPFGFTPSDAQYEDEIKL